jgi:hypothetical protein
MAHISHTRALLVRPGIPLTSYSYSAEGNSQKYVNIVYSKQNTMVIYTRVCFAESNSLLMSDAIINAFHELLHFDPK